MFCTLHAQDGAAQSTGSNPKSQQGLGGMMIPMIAIFAIMYFLLIRPQRKRQKEIEQKRDKLEKGNKILTTGGIYATVSHLKENGAVVVIDVGGNVKLEIAKSAVAEIFNSTSSS